MAHPDEEATRDSGRGDYLCLQETFDVDASASPLNEETEPRPEDIPLPEDDGSLDETSPGESHAPPLPVVEPDTQTRAAGTTSSEPPHQLQQRRIRSRNPSPEPRPMPAQTREPDRDQGGQERHGEQQQENAAANRQTPARSLAPNAPSTPRTVVNLASGLSTPSYRERALESDSDSDGTSRTPAIISAASETPANPHSTPLSENLIGRLGRVGYPQPESPTRVRGPDTGRDFMMAVGDTEVNPPSSNNAGPQQPAERADDGNAGRSQTNQDRVGSGWNRYTGPGWGTAVGLGSQVPAPTGFQWSMSAPTPAGPSGTGVHTGPQTQPGSQTGNTAPSMPGNAPPQSNSQNTAYEEPDKRQKTTHRAPKNPGSRSGITRPIRAKNFKGRVDRNRTGGRRPLRSGLMRLRDLLGDDASRRSPNNLEAQGPAQPQAPPQGPPQGQPQGPPQAPPAYTTDLDDLPDYESEHEDQPMVDRHLVHPPYREPVIVGPPPLTVSDPTPPAPGPNPTPDMGHLADLYSASVSGNDPNDSSGDSDYSFDDSLGDDYDEDLYDSDDDFEDSEDSDDSMSSVSNVDQGAEYEHGGSTEVQQTNALGIQGLTSSYLREGDQTWHTANVQPQHAVNYNVPPSSQLQPPANVSYSADAEFLPDRNGEGEAAWSAASSDPLPSDQDDEDSQSHPQPSSRNVTSISNSLPNVSGLNQAPAGLFGTTHNSGAQVPATTATPTSQAPLAQDPGAQILLPEWTRSAVLTPIPEEPESSPGMAQPLIRGGPTRNNGMAPSALRQNVVMDSRNMEAPQTPTQSANAPVFEGTQHQFPSPENQGHLNRGEARDEQNQETENPLLRQIKMAEQAGIPTGRGAVFARFLETRPPSQSRDEGRGDVQRSTRGVRRAFDPSNLSGYYDASIPRSENKENNPPLTTQSESIAPRGVINIDPARREELARQEYARQRGDQYDPQEYTRRMEAQREFARQQEKANRELIRREYARHALEKIDTDESSLREFF